MGRLGYRCEIKRSELKKLKKKFDAQTWNDYEFIEWYRRNHGIGYTIKIVED